jgi:hypothetical protein
MLSGSRKLAMASPAHTAMSRPKQTGTASHVHILSRIGSIRVSSKAGIARLVAAQNYFTAQITTPAV